MAVLEMTLTMVEEYYWETGQIPAHLCSRQLLQEVLDSLKDQDRHFAVALREALAGMN